MTIRHAFTGAYGIESLSDNMSEADNEHWVSHPRVSFSKLIKAHASRDFLEKSLSLSYPL